MLLMAVVSVVIPVMLAVLFVMAVLPAIRTLVIHRLRHHVHGRCGVINRRWLVVHWGRLHVNRAGLHIHRLVVDGINIGSANLNARQHADAD